MQTDRLERSARHIDKAMYAAGICLLLSSSACVIDDDLQVDSNRDWISFEEFEQSVYREPWDGGVYIVNGDTPIATVEELREFYGELYVGGELIVHRAGKGDAKWDDTQKNDLRYCIGSSFGSLKASVVKSMNNATGAWESAANVDFIHATDQDASCTSSNGAVVFDVQLVSGQPYLARAFFPNSSRRSRNIYIDISAFQQNTYSIDGILRHELGHALGFRHEHTRPEAGRCYEDSQWRELTPYDRGSVMHYPQCGGTNNSFNLSSLDKEGASILYGAR